MLSSAPFDNWWHSAYGLDVKILSPPHVLLLTGILAVEFGTLLMILQLRTHRVGASLDWLLFYAGGVVLGNVMIALDELAWRSDMHSAQPYRVLSAAVPVILLAVGDASGRKWGCTTVAGMYDARPAGSTLATSAFCGATQARSRLPKSDPFHPHVVSLAADRSRGRVGPLARPAGPFFQPMGPCRLRWDRICRDAACRSMALRRFSNIARGAQPVLRGTIISVTAISSETPATNTAFFQTKNL